MRICCVSFAEEHVGSCGKGFPTSVWVGFRLIQGSSTVQKLRTKTEGGAICVNPRVYQGPENCWSLCLPPTPSMRSAFDGVQGPGVDLTPERGLARRGDSGLSWGGPLRAGGPGCLESGQCWVGVLTRGWQGPRAGSSWAAETQKDRAETSQPQRRRCLCCLPQPGSSSDWTPRFPGALMRTPLSRRQLSWKRKVEHLLWNYFRNNRTVFI